MISIKNKFTFFFIISFCLFQATIILFPGWREDDSVFFLNQLKNNLFGNAFYGFNLEKSSERFVPFYYFGYQFISFFTFKPIYFFLYNLFLSLTTLILLQIIRVKLNLKYWPLFLFIIFVPGHADSFYQIVNPEKELIFFWCLFLYTLIILIEKKTSYHFDNTLIFFSLPLIIFSIFLKETSFIILFTLCTSLLVLNSKILPFSSNMRFNSKVIYILYSGVLLSLIFLVLYFIYTSSAPDKEGYHYSLTPADSIVARIMYSVKALILYAITDPLLVLLLPILFFLSVYHRVIRKMGGFTNDLINYSIFFDACAISALSLVAAYIVLGFHGYRYLLPAYPFGLIAIAAYLQNYMPIIKKYFKSIYIFVPGILLVILLINSIFSAINLAVFYKVSSYNFMNYKDILIQNINNINLNNINLVSFYIPGKSKMWMLYSADRHKDLLNFYEVNIDNIKFEYNNAYHNWLRQRDDVSTIHNLNKGDILLILPNSTISQDKILSNLRGLQLGEITQTKSPNYYELFEIRHILKYIMLSINPNFLGTGMVFREVDYAIYEVL